MPRHPLVVSVVLRKASGRLKVLDEYDARHYGVPRVGETLDVSWQTYRVLKVHRVIRGYDDDPKGYVKVLVEECEDDDL